MKNPPPATIHGWLLLLPAMAFLALYTHWPAVATFIDSFYSTPRPRRPARFIGLDNYATIVSDPVFWRSLWNNLLFALGTIPVSIALAILMAMWVNDRIAGRTASPKALLPPTLPADDRGRQHLAVLLHAAIRPTRADRRRARLPVAQLARLARKRARRRHARRDLEGSRLLHDLLSGGAAEHCAEPRGSRRARRRLALDVLPPRAVPAADADHPVRA